MSLFRNAAAILAAVFALGTAAHASPVHFYLGNTASYGPDCGDVDYGDNPDVAECSSGGISMTIKGYEYNPYTGAVNTANQLDLDQGHSLTIGSQIDNDGTDEAVVLHFDKMVKLTSLYFGHVDGNDEVKVGVLDYVGAAATSFKYYDIPGYNWTSLSLSDDHLIGKTFVVGTSADDCFYHGHDYCSDNDNWSLKYVSVEHIDVVPLPAAGWLLLAGVGGLAAVKRRKRAA